MRQFTSLALSVLAFSSVVSAESLNICVNSKTNAMTASKICPRGSAKASLATLLSRSIPKGATVYGVIGGRFTADGEGESFDAFSSLPSKTTPAFDSETDVQVAHTFACPAGGSCLTAEENDVSGECTGTAANPTAPAGKVCIYPTILGNARFLVGFNLVDGQNPNTPNAPTPVDFATGFGLGWEASDTGDSYVSAVWAYKAP